MQVDTQDDRERPNCSDVCEQESCRRISAADSTRRVRRAQAESSKDRARDPGDGRLRRLKGTHRLPGIGQHGLSARRPRPCSPFPWWSGQFKSWRCRTPLSPCLPGVCTCVWPHIVRPVTVYLRDVVSGGLRFGGEHRNRFTRLSPSPVHRMRCDVGVAHRALQHYDSISRSRR
ncbi:hypothetical protein FKP32DRAFT_928696 [Trametes sanguinea]|nr:hypothetical protein FKP32DRAFT_928696 [Trametes sanguinea]